MKRFLFTLTTIIISILLVEIFLGYLLWVKKSDVLSAIYYVVSKINSRTEIPNSTIDISFFPQLTYLPNDYLGWSNRPGKYTIMFKQRTTEQSHSFTATIDESGNRITSFTPELFKGKKEIWIFGDSFTFGFGNNDETTFPFFLQQFLPDYRIVNYGVSGYGNVHAYLQIKREFENEKTIPATIVVVYGDFFTDRNVAAPSRLKGIKQYRSELNILNDRNVATSSKQPTSQHHPRASVNNGELKIDYVPLFSELHYNAKDPSVGYQYEVTKKLLSEIYNIGKKHGTKMILAFVRGEDSDVAVAHAKLIGYVISDIRPKEEKYEWDNFGIFDDHPGPLAQDNYAIKLHRTISEVISNTGS
jgi:hypothetical protein